MTEQEKVWREIPKDGRSFLAYFPLLGVWDVCFVHTEHKGGKEIHSIVDQWYGETYKTMDGEIDEPTKWKELPE